ncbi:hypothetical protein MBANPS3_012185, partial [Mucor bainieri]
AKTIIVRITRDKDTDDLIQETVTCLKTPMSYYCQINLTTAKPTTFLAHMLLASEKLAIAERANIKADMDVKIFNTYYAFCFKLGCQYDCNFSEQWLRHVEDRNKHAQALAIGKKILKIYQVFGRQMSLIVALIPLNELKYNSYKTLQNKLSLIKSSYADEIENSGIHSSWSASFFAIFYWYSSQIYQERHLLKPGDETRCTSILPGIQRVNHDSIRQDETPRLPVIQHINNHLNQQDKTRRLPGIQHIDKNPWNRQDNTLKF